ncbi:hypothetical protein KHC28_25320 [Ancylobacter sonchi]|uniref:pYEATS domain-containing protein n=1 Tax=Ancylobacter sonchi TaxID=1937790 RepID=UPI001BD5FA0C|nr:pYEATS domain-containing protein [Ancylobacter sonchi]MBS7536971.1 hypothetical protein [Ancylobacter sonchi]
MSIHIQFMRVFFHLPGGSFMDNVRAAAAAAYAGWQKSLNKPFIIIAVMCLIIAAAEAFGQIAGDGSKVSILLALAIVTLLAPKIESFSFGSDGVKAALAKIDTNNIAATTEVDSNINVKLDQLFREVASLKAMLAPPGETPLSEALPEFVEPPPPILANDPNKGRFGGNERQNGRVLSATVEESMLNGDWCKLTLAVRPTRGAAPVTGKVVFYLHDSFSPDRYTINAERGEAVLTLRSYGAFTAGAIVDGSTMLELDLAESPNVGAPDAWRTR